MFTPFSHSTARHLRRRFPGLIALMTLLAVLAGGAGVSSRWAHSASEPMEPLPAAVSASHPPVAPSGGYVGAPSCAECHATAYRNWQGSQHAKAMQPATTLTVLGDFNDVSFTYAGITSTFFRRDGKFMVRTDGPDGQLQDYEIAYTFGVYPLQQYLIGFPDGRYQALGIAWDSRSREEGGQSWIHLYPDQNLTHRDPLHWTGLQQNWNYMCAECHSTNLHKNYDPQSQRFHTTWSEINVSCEACHGPGAEHLAWARKEGDWQKLAPTKGLTIALDERHGLRFQLRALAMQGLNPTATALTPPPSVLGTTPPATGAPSGTPQSSGRELELCARCHARRGQFWEDYLFGQPLLDTHRLALLTPDLYYLHAGHTEAAGAHELLRASLKDPDQPNIARASGAALLGERLDPAGFDALRPLLTDSDPLLRSAGARGLEALPPELKVRHLLPLLDDPVRLVRIEAARTLAAMPQESLAGSQRQALALDPQDAAAHHALGLLLIRQQRLPEALTALAEAARLGGDNPRYGYVYAVALNGASQGPKAIQELETVLAKHPNDRDSLLALTAFQRDAGNLNAARNFARRLAALEPDNPEVRALLRHVGAPTP